MRAIYLAAVAAALLLPASASAQRAGATRQQVIDHAARRFNKLDANGDGQVTSAELTAQMQARLSVSGKAFEPRMVKRMMKSNDTDGNSSISLTEFKNAAGARFDRLDANKNGKIDESEQPQRGRGGDSE